MLTAERAISRFRRDMTLGAFLRGALLTGAMVAVALNVAAVPKVDGTLILFGVGIAWVVLSSRSVKGTRLAAESPSLIAAGDFEQAEQRIEEALNSFSLFRSAKVLSLHHLALLRHAQRRWRDSAMLSRTLLRQRLGALGSLSKPSRLLLADALLEMNDLPGVYAALADLYRESLTLGEAMNLLLVQLDYESRVGAWEAMLPHGAIYKRAQLAELMPAMNAARAQALMALAALQVGRGDWAEWLRRRAELLAEPAELVRERPVLGRLWPGVAEAPAPPSNAERTSV